MLSYLYNFQVKITFGGPNRALGPTGDGFFHFVSLLFHCSILMPALAKSERIKALFILDSEGRRVCAKFYAGNFKTVTEQDAMEKKLPKSAEPNGSDGTPPPHTHTPPPLAQPKSPLPLWTCS